jgi:hypothetical protein
MRVFRFAVPLALLLATDATAQDAARFKDRDPNRGASIDFGSGLDNGVSFNYRFNENWSIRPTLGLGYQSQTGVQFALGSTVLRSFGYGNRVYGYLGAGVHFGSANRAYDPYVHTSRANQQNLENVAYATTPVGLRVRLFGDIEAFAEGAYQRAFSGRFGYATWGQFHGNDRARYGATFGVSLRID